MVTLKHIPPPMLSSPLKQVHLSEHDLKIIHTLKDGKINGKNNHQVAKEVFMSKRSFDYKIADICQRLGLETNRATALVIYAYEKRLISPPDEINAQKHTSNRESQG